MDILCLLLITKNLYSYNVLILNTNSIRFLFLLRKEFSFKKIRCAHINRSYSDML